MTMKKLRIEKALKAYCSPIIKMAETHNRQTICVMSYDKQTMGVDQYERETIELE